MVSGGVLTLLAAFTRDYAQLLVLRALLGFMLGDESWDRAEGDLEAAAPAGEDGDEERREGDDPEPADLDQGDGQACFAATRTAQASRLLPRSAVRRIIASLRF